MSQIRLIVLLVLSLLALVPSFAQRMNDKASPCPDAVTTLDMAKCFSNAKDAADSGLILRTNRFGRNSRRMISCV